MKTKTIHHTVSINAPVNAVYRALMDSRQHSKLTESKAVIGTSVGSKFSVWGGAVSGITLHLIPNKMIVQAWRTEGWPVGHYSVAVFSFSKKVKGTALVFDHYAVPADDYKSIAENWKGCYWNPLKIMLQHQP